MVRIFVRLLILFLAAIGVLAITLGLQFVIGGVSATGVPGRMEAGVARRLRSLAIPRDVAGLRNPVERTPEVVAAGMAHFADHCASCHANDGSGDTEMGRGLYPKAPDMRLPATQSLSDGELFYIIENGVRLTGMPAWGNDTADGRTASWHLVHFIRHLPKLTESELEEMRNFNPRSPDEWREEEETRRFLDGDGTAPAPSDRRHTHGGHQ